MELNKELIAKAREAKSPEELLALAKENEIELTEESAAAYFEQLNPKTGELADEELDNVSGGCRTKNGDKIVTVGHCCDRFRCKYCGHGKGRSKYYKLRVCRNCGVSADCNHCYHCNYQRGLWLCFHPAYMKIG